MRVLSSAPSLQAIGYFQREDEKPAEMQLTEEFGYLQKNIVYVFYIFNSIFDNFKSDLHKTIIELSSAVLGCSFFEFTFSRLHPLFSADVSRYVRAAGTLVATMESTHNRPALEALAGWTDHFLAHAQRLRAASDACSADELQVVHRLLRMREEHLPFPFGQVTPAALAFYTSIVTALIVFEVLGKVKNMEAIDRAQLFNVDPAMLVPTLHAFARLRDTELSLFHAHAEHYAEVYFYRLVEMSNRESATREPLPRFSLPFDEYSFRIFRSTPLLTAELLGPRTLFLVPAERKAAVVAELAAELKLLLAADRNDASLLVLSAAMSVMEELLIRNRDGSPFDAFPAFFEAEVLTQLVLPAMHFAADYLAKHGKALKRVYLRCFDAWPMLSLEEIGRYAAVDFFLGDVFHLVKQLLSLFRDRLYADQRLNAAQVAEMGRFCAGVSAFFGSLRPESVELIGLRDRVFTSEGRGGADSVQKEDLVPLRLRDEGRLNVNLPKPWRKFFSAAKAAFSELFSTRQLCLARVTGFALRVELPEAAVVSVPLAQLLGKSREEAKEQLLQAIDANSEGLQANREQIAAQSVDEALALGRMLREIQESFADLPRLCASYTRYTDVHFIYPLLLRALRHPALADLQPRCVTALIDCVRQHMQRFAGSFRSPSRLSREENSALPTSIIRLHALLVEKKLMKVEGPVLPVFEACVTFVDGRRLGELIAAIFALFHAQEATPEAREELCAFAGRVLDLSRNSKPRVMNELSLGACLDGLARALAPDDALSEALFSRNGFELFKKLLRVELAETLPATHPIFGKMRLVIEAGFRGTATVEALFRMEIFDFLRNRAPPTRLTDLARHALLVVRPETREAFGRALQRVGRPVSGGEPSVALQENKVQAELRPVLHDFLALLTKDLRYKLDLRRGKAARPKLFNDLFLCDVIFFQLLPRYPDLYARAKLHPAHRLLVDASVQLSPHFAQFLKPLFSDSALRVGGREESETQDLNEAVLGRVLLHLRATADELLAQKDADGAEHARILLASANLGCVLLYCCAHEKFYALFRSEAHDKAFCAFFETMGLFYRRGWLSDPRALSVFFNFAEVFRQREIIFALSPDARLAEKETRRDKPVPTAFRRWPTERLLFRLTEDDRQYYDLRARLPAEGARSSQKRVFLHRVQSIGQNQVEIWERASTPHDTSRESLAMHNAGTEADPFFDPGEDPANGDAAEPSEEESEGDEDDFFHQAVMLPEQTDAGGEDGSPSLGESPERPDIPSEDVSSPSVASETGSSIEEESGPEGTSEEGEVLRNIHIEVEEGDYDETDPQTPSLHDSPDESGSSEENEEEDGSRSSPSAAAQSEQLPATGAAQPGVLFRAYPFAYPVTTHRRARGVYHYAVEASYFTELVRFVGEPLAAALQLNTLRLEREVRQQDVRHWRGRVRAEPSLLGFFRQREGPAARRPLRHGLTDFFTSPGEMPSSDHIDAFVAELGSVWGAAQPAAPEPQAEAAPVPQVLPKHGRGAGGDGHRVARRVGRALRLRGLRRARQTSSSWSASTPASSPFCPTKIRSTSCSTWGASSAGSPRRPRPNPQATPSP